ncbi:uncharacterized protein N7506_003902, partial [Penicillium brevicompactum]|uniref:uncharacterized protein n=1 Tax=Penicillium brevicompactum TaxID=5074 RepID=UPI002540922B
FPNATSTLRAILPITPRCRSIGPIESESQNESDTDSDESAIFTDNRSKKDSNSKSEPDGDDTNNKSDSNDKSFNDKSQLPPKHYLAEAKSLDHWQWISDSDDTVHFLYQFFAWRCDIQQASSLAKETIIKKGLELIRRPKKNMYIEDVAEFTCVLLTTIETTFDCGWQHIQVLLFCQLAAIIASHLGALFGLRYWDIVLMLIRDLEGGRLQLFIYLTPEFMKRFFGKKVLWVPLFFYHEIGDNLAN